MLPSVLHIRLVFELQPRHQQAHGDEIAVRQPRGDAPHVLRRAGDAQHQVLDGHGADDDVRRQRALLPVLHIAHARHAAAFHAQPAHAAAHAYVRALLARALGHRLPELAGAVLGVAEFLDQRGLHLVLVGLAGAQFAQHVRQNGANGQPLDALRAPGRGDLARVAAPELFRVALKEHGIELPTKAVDVEILQRILRQPVRRRRQIAHARLYRGGKAHVADGVGVHAHGIIEELLVVVDARNAPAGEHHLVAGLRVRPARLQRHVAPKDAIVHRRRALQGHELFPPGHHAVVLGKETVAADVHAVAVVAHGAGDAADGQRFLEGPSPHSPRRPQAIHRPP